MEKLLTKERAEGIQRTLLNDIQTTIPARLIEPFWETYQEVLGTIKSRPCTCTPKYWLQIVDEMRELVRKSLEHYNRLEVIKDFNTQTTEESGVSLNEDTEPKKKQRAVADARKKQ
jgi:hypothetical protein